MTEAHSQEKRTATSRLWGVVLTALSLIALLILLANLRFAIPLVMPPRPLPDYALQAAWCSAGAVMVGLLALATVLLSARAPQHRRGIHTSAIVTMIVLGAGCGVTALAVSAP